MLPPLGAAQLTNRDCEPSAFGMMLGCTLRLTTGPAVTGLMTIVAAVAVVVVLPGVLPMVVALVVVTGLMTMVVALAVVTGLMTMVAAVVVAVVVLPVMEAMLVSAVLTSVVRSVLEIVGTGRNKMRVANTSEILDSCMFGFS